MDKPFPKNLQTDPALQYAKNTAHRVCHRSIEMKYFVFVIIAIASAAFGYYAQRELAIDACLDAGGQWSPSRGVCIGIPPSP